MEVANIVNSIPHSLIVERVDPPLKNIPKEGEEIRASYAFSNALGRKVVACKLTTMARSGRAPTKKVMCRVGGGTFACSQIVESLLTCIRRLAGSPTLCYVTSICMKCIRGGV